VIIREGRWRQRTRRKFGIRKEGENENVEEDKQQKT
jgi:hypothetical protein